VHKGRLVEEVGRKEIPHLRLILRGQLKPGRSRSTAARSGLPKHSFYLPDLDGFIDECHKVRAPHSHAEEASSSDCFQLSKTGIQDRLGIEHASSGHGA
jgi:hypothetical protein